MRQQYIISDKAILLGKPTIKGTRICVELILELLSSSWTEQQVLKRYPNLTHETLQAVSALLNDQTNKKF